MLVIAFHNSSLKNVILFFGKTHYANQLKDDHYFSSVKNSYGDKTAMEILQNYSFESVTIVIIVNAVRGLNK